MSAQPQPQELIKKPDGSFIPFDDLKPEDQLEHRLAVSLCEEAQALSEELRKFKQHAIAEMIATRVMMLEDFGVKKGGKEGNLTMRSKCGRHMVKMSVSKHITFGKELEAAKALIFEFLEDELAKGGSEAIHAIVSNVFKLNGKGRIDTGGILGLREHRFEDERWEKAMQAIEEAIIRDTATTYVYFYNVDPHAEPKASGEVRIPMNISEV